MNLRRQHRSRRHLGALAGFAVGVVVAQRIGGLSGLTARLREGIDSLIASRSGRHGVAAPVRDRGDEEEYDGEYDEELEDEGDVDDRTLDPDSALEERVLEAFRNDPILSERAIDIGAIGEGIIELAGWVETTRNRSTP